MSYLWVCEPISKNHSSWDLIWCLQLTWMWWVQSHERTPNTKWVHTCMWWHCSHVRRRDGIAVTFVDLSPRALLATLTRFHIIHTSIIHTSIIHKCMCSGMPISPLRCVCWWLLSRPGPNLVPLVMGFVIFLAHVVLIPVTGCGINPVSDCNLGHAGGGYCHVMRSSVLSSLLACEYNWHDAKADLFSQRAVLIDKLIPKKSY